MDFENQKRRHGLKVIVSEILMVIAVIITVVILALIVSGYWLNSDLKVERQGMLQISSIPTGATIEIDGKTSSWLERTNTSKVLSANEHTITLTKEGYDSWSRTINITEGLLYRIHYPRLFLNDRTTKSVYDSNITTFATVSPDGNYLLLANNTTSWNLLSLEDETINPQKLDISTIFSSVSLANNADTGLFTGEIISANWSEDSSHVLFKINNNNSTEWVILNPKNIKESTNITREFATDFSRIEILDNSANTLLVVRNNNLHKIDIPARQISAILVEDIFDFDHYGSEIVFSAKLNKSIIESNEPDAVESTTVETQPSNPNTNYQYYIGLTKVGETKITTFKKYSNPVKVVISKFYDDKYITTLDQDTITLYKKEDFSEMYSSTLSFTPNKIQVGHEGEFIEFTTDTQFATLDMEAQYVREWTIDSSHYGWLDHDMLYSIDKGQLIVYDFDGLNRRMLSKNLSERFPVAVTNDEWLYYFSDGKLIRETIK